MQRDKTRQLDEKRSQAVVILVYSQKDTSRRTYIIMRSSRRQNEECFKESWHGIVLKQTLFYYYCRARAAENRSWAEALESLGQSETKRREPREDTQQLTIRSFRIASSWKLYLYLSTEKTTQQKKKKRCGKHLDSGGSSNGAGRWGGHLQ